ncbi:hypothetical protein CONPUDRAFT_54071 [Coniophora puteana RWD-64-598 SS2]|uniref:Glycoside hydrolase family 125 protein n=1 Tax=Coniophora puteana (strain RWD-64-598) TaxID=741705 RepID=A0A5M3MUD9_CONPW|nr:uncharacterized protein CONPUDRAFT_54071 [Coniophora puteana RWD-64-598 SS2]EIW82211.1 hypothetical protein CONPUDRAFT_54071 [Coniophora puteana RWD-64-598 SS2]
MKFSLGGFAVAASLGALASAADSSCPDYTTYSQSPQGNASTGSLGLPYMRPDPACRTFNSSVVEKVISDVTSRMKDPDLARLFENTFPNTLDTTVKYFNSSENLAFIITGDINAQWLRDTGNQFAQYRPLLSQDKELATLVKAVINNEARYVSEYPYCGAFQPPPESGLPPTVNTYALLVDTEPPVNNQTVFECKYELDSLAGFLKLSVSYYTETKDKGMMTDQWLNAIDQIFQVINNQSQASFDSNWNWYSSYNWTGEPGSYSPQVVNDGAGEPRGYTGLVGSHHRPSDDICIFPFITSDNAMMSVELTNLANVLDDAQIMPNISAMAKNYSQTIHDAIWNHTVVAGAFAYETNGLGSTYIMDDANVPSLLSLPYLGFLGMNDSTYVATRNRVLSRANPYYAQGINFTGIGGPHVDAWNPWPMSQITNIFGTDSDDEIIKSLGLIANNTYGLGLIHESVNIYNGSDYTRPWFAWANSYFSEMILDLAQRKPHLIFTDNTPYIIGNSTSSNSTSS